MVVENAQEAEKLVNLQGANVTGFDFTFDPQTLEQLLADPIAPDEK